VAGGVPKSSPRIWAALVAVAAAACVFIQECLLFMVFIIPSEVGSVCQILYGSLGVAVIPARCRDKIEGKKQEKRL
jgi:hypothetical protein